MNMDACYTLIEWVIVNYNSKSDIFSEPGDSGAIIADVCGHVSGLLTSGAGKTKSSNMMYTTPFSQGA